jgi:hypothetical protein
MYGNSPVVARVKECSSNPAPAWDTNDLLVVFE